MFKNILIFGHSNIGDVIYDLAVINPLRESYPNAKITFLCSSRCWDIVSGYKGIDRIIVLDRHGKNRGFFSRLCFTAALRKEKFDLVIVLTSSLNYILLRAPAVWRVQRQMRLRHDHPVDRYIDTLRFYGLIVKDASFSFGLNEKDVSFSFEFLKYRGIDPRDTLIGILPLAAWSLKSWPIEKWNSLADILRKKWGIRVLNLGKLPDNKLGRRIADEISGNIIPADETTLPQAKALLSRCQLFIGPDSSLLHLASCMGIETIGLYGPTPVSRFYPYFHRHNSISSKNKLACMPCYPDNKPSCRTNMVKHDFGPCMCGIEVEDVLTVIKERLNLK
jgi:heptosyltransferase I